MRLNFRWGVVAILLALPCWSMVPAGAAIQQDTQDTQLARLAGLGKLWGYIKFTHPWMGEKTRQWDQALVAAIPMVKSASSVEEYERAIDHMLSLLGDPATRRMSKTRPGDEVASVAAIARAQPSIEWPAPDLAVITASDYVALDNSPTGRNDLARMIGEAAKAKTVVLDIRRLRDAKNVARIG